MDFTIEATPKPAHRYRLPALLQDIRLLDLLEISGTTQEAARSASLSQPTVSRRTRSLASDFGLKPNRHQQLGCCYGTSTAMRLLRLGCRAHRLSAGVARLGADVILQPLLAGCSWLLPAPPRFRPLDGWLELVRQGVLDGALVSGLEFQGEEPPDAKELELLPLGAVLLDLVVSGRHPHSNGDQPEVLVPNRAVAEGLQRALLQHGFSLKTAGNACHTPAQWLARLQQAGLAMPFPQVAPADWWQPLTRLPQPAPISVPLWLVLPEGWRRQVVLTHTAERLAYSPAQKYAPGA
jgi:DNA-binding transcriptional LysR family regulator